MTVHKFALNGDPDREAIETDVALALFEASYLVADDGGACVLKATGRAGEAAALVFAGLTAARIGEEGYSVRRQDDLA